MLLLSSFIGLLSGLAGAFIGRKTQQESWLFQKRAEVFSGFLLALEKSREDAAHYLRDHSAGEAAIINREIYDLYEPVFARAKVARLFLEKDAGTKLEDLLRHVYAAQSSPKLGDERHRSIIEMAEKIQRILEESLGVPGTTSSALSAIEKYLYKYRILLGLIFAGILICSFFGDRYQLSRNSRIVYKLDRWTGRQWGSDGDGWRPLFSQPRYRQTESKPASSPKTGHFDDLIPQGR